MRNILTVVTMLLTISPLSFAQSADNETNVVVPYKAPYTDNTTATTLEVPNLNGKVISNLVFDDVSKLNMVLVEKATYSLYKLEMADNGYTIIDADHIMHGSGGIPEKNIRGDNKTPQGLYYIVDYRSGQSLVNRYGPYAEIYGAGSLPLNYPNPIDKLNKKTGGGIWLHGRDDSVAIRKETQGCVALTNPDFEVLKDFVTINHPVLITDNFTYMTEEEYSKHRVETLDKFYSFINTWANSDEEGYKKHIHERYGNKKNGGKHYADRKISLMNSYPERVVFTDNTKIFTDDNKNYVVDANVFYAAPNITSYTNKRYYFVLDDNDVMQLVNEQTFAKDSTPIVTAEVEKFINNWSITWDSQLINDYMTYYDNRFSSNGMNFNAWKSSKERLFAKGEDIKVEISNIKWRKTANDRYIVTFVQEYSSSTLSDKGIKTLTLKGYPTNFTILSETWKAM